MFESILEAKLLKREAEEPDGQGALTGQDRFEAMMALREARTPEKRPQRHPGIEIG